MHTGHERQLCNQSSVVVGSHDAHGIEPARLAEDLGGVGVDHSHIRVVQRVVADVVEVGTALLVTLDSLGVKVGVGVELGIVFVGEEHPETLVLGHSHAT